MVSVAFAIWLFPQRLLGAHWGRTGSASRQNVPPQSAHFLCPCIQCSKRRANLQGYLTPLWLRYCMAIGAGRFRMMSMMYQAYQNHMDLTAPWRNGAASALKYLNLVPQGISDRLF